MQPATFPFALVFLVWVMSSAGQVVGSDKSTWPCGGHPKLLRDENGTPVWIDSDELKKRAIRQVEPKPPFHGNVDATIVVDVLIDTTGTIKCERTTSGHPLLRKISERAAKQWKFRRLLAGSTPVAVYGHLIFRIKE